MRRRSATAEPEPEPEREREREVGEGGGRLQGGGGRGGRRGRGGSWDRQAVEGLGSVDGLPVLGGSAAQSGMRGRGCKVVITPGDLEVGRLGLTLTGVAIDAICPGGAADAHVARAALRPGMLLVSINGLSTDRLAYNAIVDVASGDVRGMSLVFSNEEHRADAFDDLRNVHLEFGSGHIPAGQQLGITFRRVAVHAVDPRGMAALRAEGRLQPGMILANVNQVPADRMPYQAILNQIHGRDDGSGLSLSFDQPNSEHVQDSSDEDAESCSVVSSSDLDDWSSADMFSHRPGLRRHSSPFSSCRSEAVFGDHHPDIVTVLDEQLADSAGDFDALTTVLDAVSDGDSTVSSITTAFHNHAYDEAIELSSVVSSSDSCSTLADGQDADEAIHTGQGRDVPDGDIESDLPIGGIPCAAVSERDDSMYDALDISEEARALFSHIDAYRPRQVELTPVLKPFLIDMLPAIRDPDPMVSVPRPDGQDRGLGVVALDEHHNRLLPAAGGTILLGSLPELGVPEDAKEFDAAESESVVEVAGCFGLEPSQLLEFAEYLDVDIPREPELLPLVAETMVATLPAGWVECEDDETGMMYYHNEDMCESRWEHPLDAECRNRLDMERQTQWLLRMDIRTARRAKLGMIASLFAQFDADVDGRLNRTEYRRYLMAIGVWACSTPYTDLHWGWTWRSLCDNHRASPQDGLGPADFAKRYLGPGREAMLAKDFVRAADENPLPLQVVERYCNMGYLLPVLRPWTSRTALVAAQRLAPVHRVIVGTGAPSEAAVAFILLTFYRSKHPEFAHMHKVRRVIGSFQAQAAARKESGPTWVSLLWEAFAAEGAAPVEELYVLAARAQAAVTIQIVWRRWYQGRNTKWTDADRNERAASMTVCDQPPKSKAAPTPVGALEIQTKSSDFEHSLLKPMAVDGSTSPSSRAGSVARERICSASTSSAVGQEREPFFLSPRSDASASSSVHGLWDGAPDSIEDDVVDAAADALLLELEEQAEELAYQATPNATQCTMTKSQGLLGQRSPKAKPSLVQAPVTSISIFAGGMSDCDESAELHDTHPQGESDAPAMHDGADTADSEWCSAELRPTADANGQLGPNENERVDDVSAGCVDDDDEGGEDAHVLGIPLVDMLSENLARETTEEELERDEDHLAESKASLLIVASETRPGGDDTAVPNDAEGEEPLSRAETDHPAITGEWQVFMEPKQPSQESWLLDVQHQQQQEEEAADDDAAETEHGVPPTESKPSTLKNDAAAMKELHLTKVVAGTRKVGEVERNLFSQPPWVVDPEGLGAFSFETDQLLDHVEPKLPTTVSASSATSAAVLAHASLPFDMLKKVAKHNSYGTMHNLGLLGSPSSIASHKLCVPEPTSVTLSSSPWASVPSASSSPPLSHSAPLPSSLLAGLVNGPQTGGTTTGAAVEGVLSDEDSALENHRDDHAPEPELDSHQLDSATTFAPQGEHQGGASMSPVLPQHQAVSPLPPKSLRHSVVEGEQEGIPPTPTLGLSQVTEGGSISEGDPPLLPLLRQRLREAMSM